MIFLGIDIGSSSVKTSLISGDTGRCLGSAFYPKKEMEMIAVNDGWAEQHPEVWWANFKQAFAETIAQSNISPQDITAIGIAYQMHGLVLVDAQKEVIRPAIIWCDSRAVEIGETAMTDIGADFCLSHYLNSPGNFTASKLRWVQQHEPESYSNIWKIMLPGDYIAMKLSGEVTTTVSGLSEGVMWDFKENSLAQDLFSYYSIETDKVPRIVDTFSKDLRVSQEAASETGLSTQAYISYRAGDQPNNAFSLNVLEPGEVAATAGTSGVVYGISGKVQYDEKSRVNTFAHVNHTEKQTRLGVLLCINGTGILNSWLQKNIAKEYSYTQMDALAASIPIGSEGLFVLPFGNGAERVLENKKIGASFHNLNFNIHSQAHMVRAAHEGIAFSFYYGIEIMKEMGMSASTIRAGHANMFLSPVFRNIISGVSEATIELFDTDGAQGAARGAGLGYGYYASTEDSFVGLTSIKTVEPDTRSLNTYAQAYMQWKELVTSIINK